MPDAKQFAAAMVGSEAWGGYFLPAALNDCATAHERCRDAILAGNHALALIEASRAAQIMQQLHAIQMAATGQPFAVKLGAKFVPVIPMKVETDTPSPYIGSEIT